MVHIEYGKQTPYPTPKVGGTTHVCKLCGKEYGSSDTARSYDACNECNAIYMRERNNVPENFMHIRHSYTYDFGCYAKYHWILLQYSDREITFEQRQQKIADLIKEYEVKEGYVNAEQQAKQQAQTQQRAENMQRLHNIFGN